MTSNSVGTADVANKLTQWSPQPALVAADELLGVDLPDRPFFQHSSIDHVKLPRNTLAKHDMKNKDGEAISWSNIKELHSLQTKEGLCFANKLTAAHVDKWHRQ